VAVTVAWAAAAVAAVAVTCNRLRNIISRAKRAFWPFLPNHNSGPYKGIQPIVFVSEEGKFEVKEAMHASCPLINVTGYRAAVYAKHYGMKLPTDTQWLYVLQKDVQAKHSEEVRGATNTTQLQLPIPTPVMLYPPNSYGIRALNGNIGEWGLRSHHEDEENSDTEYVVLGASKSASGMMDGGVLVIRSSPKKTYADVGFRTVSRTKPE
jgi:formylglycine-generating enzyme required for sulfatase activity